MKQLQFRWHSYHYSLGLISSWSGWKIWMSEACIISSSKSSNIYMDNGNRIEFCVIASVEVSGFNFGKRNSKKMFLETVFCVHKPHFNSFLHLISVGYYGNRSTSQYNFIHLLVAGLPNYRNQWRNFHSSVGKCLHLKSISPSFTRKCIQIQRHLNLHQL